MSLQLRTQGGSSTLPSSSLRINLRPEALFIFIGLLAKEHEARQKKKRAWTDAWKSANKERIKAYNAADHARRQQDPEFQKKKAENSAQWREENPEKVAAQAPMKLAYKKTEKGIAAEQRYRRSEKSVERNRKYVREREARDPSLRIAPRLRHRVYLAVKAQGLIKSEKTFELIGCDWSTLKARLESLFQPGMTWENFGIWHVDHTTPCALFDLSNPEQRACCFHYTNLAPMWGSENCSKGAKLKISGSSI